MRTAVANIEVQRGGVQSENTFTIKATSKAFDILSSGLYSDKIKAIVRELSCNAYDSHVAAGKADLPIEVKLPTHLDHTFYVKDFGLGLSHDDLIQIYTTYFESTKTNSDDFIGQLGLGSKSPFSYAATFTVESRFDGTKRVYTCFKNEQGMPAISLMGEENTDEPNGLTVSLAVKRDDVEKFNEAARKVFMYFSPQPSIKGQEYFRPYKINHTIAGTNWKIRETEYSARMEKAYVVQGFVAYPVDTHILVEQGLSSAARKLANTNLDLYVDIGKVEVAASREALSYDIRTIQNLVAVLEGAAKEMRGSFQKEFDLCKSQWDVGQLFGKFIGSGSYEFREIFESMHNSAPFNWNGKPALRKVELDLTGVNHTTIRRMSMSSRKATAEGVWTPDNTTKKMTYDIGHQNLHILVDTEAKGHSQLAEFFLLTKGNTTGHSPHVIIISPTSKKLFRQAEVDQIVRQLGNPTVIKSSDLTFTRAKVGGYKKRAVEEKMMWKGFPEREDRYGRKETREVFSRLCWTTQNVDLEDGGFYIPVERFTAVHKHGSISSLDEMIAAAHSLGMIDTDFELYGMNERDLKHIAGNDEWINFADHFQAEFDKLNVNKALFNRCVYDAVISQLGRRVNSFFVDAWNTRRAQLTEGNFVAFFDSLRDLGQSAASVDAQVVMRAINILGMPTNYSATATNMYQEWRNVASEYEMLSLIDWNQIDSSSIDKVVNYINTIEATKP